MTNRKLTKRIILSAMGLLSMGAATAGNPERNGQAGASQLTINGMARGSGWGWAYGASAKGVEATFLNPAGMDRGRSTEVTFNRTEWLRGSGIGINNFAFTQRLGADGSGGSLGINVQQFGIKPIDITTYDNPDGGIGTYRVNMSNVGLGYSKGFNNSIYAGVMVRYVSEGIPDVRMGGLSLDAGVQYATTLRPVNLKLKRNDLKFGISVKNLGGDLRPTGNGLAYKTTLNGLDKNMLIRADRVKLPALLNIAVSYDMRLDKSAETYNNRLTWAFAFTNHSFSTNQTTLGLEYSYKDYFSLRGSYVYMPKNNILDQSSSTFSGINLGFSYDMKIGEENVLGLSYSFRPSKNFGITHAFGVVLGIGAEN